MVAVVVVAVVVVVVVVLLLAVAVMVDPGYVLGFKAVFRAAYAIVTLEKDCITEGRVSAFLCVTAGRTLPATIKYIPPGL